MKYRKSLTLLLLLALALTLAAPALAAGEGEAAAVEPAPEAGELEITGEIGTDAEAVGAGDVIHFTVTLSNTGTGDLEDIRLTDNLLEMGENAQIGKLAAGESVSFCADYFLTPEDMDAGNLIHYLSAADGDGTPLAVGGGIVFIAETAPWYAQTLMRFFRVLGPEWGRHFEERKPVTRGDFIRTLYILTGGSADGETGSFSDISAGSELADAAAWGVAHGVTEGCGDGTFRPGEPVTREQMAVMLYRYAQSLDMGYTGLWMFPLEYPDAAQISDWADEAMHWMVQNRIIMGTTEGLEPRSGATMPQCYAILDRFADLLAEQ